MFGALGQYQHLVPLLEGDSDLVRYRRSAAGVTGDMPEHVLDSGVGSEIEASCQVAGDHLQSLRRANGLRCGVSGWPTLHEDDRLSPIAPDWRRGEPKYILGLGALQNGLE